MLLRKFLVFHEPDPVSGANAAPNVVLDGENNGNPANTPPADSKDTQVSTAVLDGGDATSTAKSEEKPADSADKKPEQVDYKDFTFPEGITSDAELVSEFKAFAKERGLSQEDAQKAVDMGSKMLLKSYQKEEAAFEQTKKEWHEQLVADKEYGGLKLKETVERANWTLRHFTENMGEEGKEFRRLFATGTNNHPTMFKFLANIAKAMGESKIVEGSPPAQNTGVKTAGEVMYPDMPVR